MSSLLDHVSFVYQLEEFLDIYYSYFFLSFVAHEIRLQSTAEIVKKVMIQFEQYNLSKIKTTARKICIFI